MANRSYLYTLDYDSSEIGWKKEGKILGLSEWAYDIPFSYKILVSVDAKLSKSINWESEETLAIIGDFKEGKKRLFMFIEDLRSHEFFEKEEFEQVVTECKKFFDDPKRDLDYVILETTEIFGMDGDDIEDYTCDLYKYQIHQVNMGIRNAIKELKALKMEKLDLEFEIFKMKKNRSLFDKIFKKKEREKTELLQKKIEKINRQMWDVVGIDYWREILYYHFDENQ